MKHFVGLAETENASGLVKDASGLVRDASGLVRDASGLVRNASGLVRGSDFSGRVKDLAKRSENLVREADDVDGKAEYTTDAKDSCRLMKRTSGLVRNASGLVRVAGDKAYSTDVLGSAKISCALGMNGVTENPEGRTDTILTEKEHDDGNLIIVGGPAVNPIATEFDGYFNIAYDYKQDESFQIFAEDKSLFLDLENYPETDICIVYLGEHNNRNVLIVWGYGWQGTYAGSVFAADPQNWQTYKGSHLFFLRWIDTNGDGLVQAAEITVEDFL